MQKKKAYVPQEKALLLFFVKLLEIIVAKIERENV